MPKNQILYVLRENKNAKMPEAKGKYYAFPVTTQTIDTDGLAAHMASHNTPFSKGAFKGMLTDMVGCIKELALQGYAIKIDDLAIFSIGIKNKEGAASEKEFSVQKNIEGFKLRARGTGEFRAVNLDTTLKRVTSLAGLTEEGADDSPSSGGGNSPSQGGSSSTTEGGGSSSSGEGTTPKPGENVGLE